MEKKFFLNLLREIRRLGVIFIAIGIFSVFIAGGCGKKIYIPPDKEVKSHIILINEIYNPGFYVEMDGMDAGFLLQELDLRVKPGEHKLKIFNKETALSLLKEKQETIIHNFDLKVKVDAGEYKKVVLSWVDKAYSKEVRKGVRPAKEEKEKKRKRPSDVYD